MTGLKWEIKLHLLPELFMIAIVFKSHQFYESRLPDVQSFNFFMFVAFYCFLVHWFGTSTVLH